MESYVDWLRLIRFLTQYVAPGLVTIVLIAEITEGFWGALVLPTVAIAYNYFVLIVFSLLTTIMIGIFGWAPSGIWASILRPSPAQPWQAWQLAFCPNSLPPSVISDGSSASAHATEPETRANSTPARAERSSLRSRHD